MQYNIIGDIHGRTNWKKLLREDSINVFLGDYFDPYTNISGVKELNNYEDIINYKKEHPETILLLGNHDMQYLFDEPYSRYNYYFAKRMKKALLDNLSLFQIAYSIDNRVLLTHAGVTHQWMEMAGLIGKEDAVPCPDEVARLLNGLLTPDCKQLYLFRADYSFGPGDYCGESATASPVWVRPDSLLQNGIYPADAADRWQVVGHTQTEIQQIDNIAFIDCLGQTEPASLVITVTPDEKPQFMVNDLQK